MTSEGEVNKTVRDCQSFWPQEADARLRKYNAAGQSKHSVRDLEDGSLCKSVGLGRHESEVVEVTRE